MSTKIDKKQMRYMLSETKDVKTKSAEILLDFLGVPQRGNRPAGRTLWLV
jgi:hypothetical protein